MRVVAIVVIGWLDWLDCRAPKAPKPAPKPAVSDRVPAVDRAHPWAVHQEQPERDGECARDADCFIGGCAHYACNAVRDFLEACDDTPALPPEHAQCGCVAGRCQWWRKP